MSYSVPRCLHLIAEMGVADALGDESRTAEQLAAATGADAGALNRALRLLAAYGIFEPCDGGYVHTETSRLLRTDHPQSMRSFVGWCGAAINWQCFELLGYSIQTGRPSTEKIAPEGPWAYLQQHPEVGRLFDEAMTGKSQGMAHGVIANYDFSAYKTIADIGGGRGHLLLAVLDKAPGAAGVLFDQPHVLEPLKGKVPARVKLQGGDFFKDKLPACDVYMAMHVIHDWNDQESIEILSGIRRAAPSHAKLLLVEGIVPDDSHPSWIKMLDLFMLTTTTGKERTRREFQDLFAASGFRLDKVIDIGMGMSVLEASVV